MLVALGALARGRKSAKRLERLTESYWELRYDYGQLRARLNALEPKPEEDAATPGPETPVKTGFISLASLKAGRGPQ